MQSTRFELAALLLLIASVGFGRPASAQAEVPLTTTRVASGLANPVFVSAPAGDTQRLFIVEQYAGNAGRIRVLDLATETLLPTPYLSISPVATGPEEGLLGLAFDPDFATNGFFFVYYTNSALINVIVRYQAFVPFLTSNLADPASATQVVTIGPPSVFLHNGGWIGFGPDRYLYVGSGDGGSGGAPSVNAQDKDNLLGKILRIDIDPLPYSSPPTNPFFGAIPGRDEIWHYGLRNPWRSSFDRASGDLIIADVGEAQWEEIDFQPAGRGGLNFGWRCMEGLACTGLSSCTCGSPALTLPVHQYSHSDGCSVTGGYVYRGGALCGVQGTYFFGDYCSARIWSFRLAGGSVMQVTERTSELAPGGGLSIDAISSFGEDAAGELYICDHDGEVYRIVPRATVTVDCNGNGAWDVCDIQVGASVDLNQDAVPDECQAINTFFCFGDGTQGTPCPCANNGASGRGCENSAATGGARLTAIGSTSPDTVLLSSAGEPSAVLTIFLQGDAITSAIFGDGVRCVGGILKRLDVHNAIAGTASYPGFGDPSITQRSANLGDPIAPGSTRYYQAHYRDPELSFCPSPPGNSFNVSSGVQITW